MIAPAQLQAMTPEQRTALFIEMASERWGQRGYVGSAAEVFGVTRQATARWRNHHIVPFAVLYTLDAWRGTPIPESLPTDSPDFAQIGALLAEAGTLLAGVRFPTDARHSGFASVTDIPTDPESAQ